MLTLNDALCKFKSNKIVFRFCLSHGLEDWNCFSKKKGKNQQHRILSFQCLVSTRRPHILTKTSSFQLQVYLSMCAFQQTPETQGLKVFKIGKKKWNQKINQNYEKVIEVGNLRGRKKLVRQTLVYLRPLSNNDGCFCEKSQRLRTYNYSCHKASSQMFDRDLNLSLHEQIKIYRSIRNLKRGK